MEEYKNISYGRISYEPHPKKPGVLKSAHTIISARTGASYEVHLDEVNKKYWIKNINSESLINMPEESKITNRNVLLRTIKKHLRKLGVVFKTELRNRNFGLCPKGYNQRKHKEKLSTNIPTSNIGLGN